MLRHGQRQDRQEIHLTPTEYRLLEFLLRRPGRVASRSSIVEAVWGFNEEIEDNTLDAFGRLLRSKVDRDYKRQIDPDRVRRGLHHSSGFEDMRPFPIRVKLTAWYLAILAFAFAAFGGAAFIAMRPSIETSVDESLQDRADGIRELIERVLPEGRERLEVELREHSELSEEGGLSQVSDEQGDWLYRSGVMRRYDVPRSSGTGKAIYNLQAQDLPLRVLATEVQAGGHPYRVQVAAPMDDFNDALDHFKWVLLLSSPVLLLLASVGGYWIGRRALLPLDEITRATRTITSTNMSSWLTVPQSHDELQYLSETLNGMLERLEAAFRRTTQFTADASHELRTPVALMRTTAELSLRKSRPEGEYREALAQILRELETTSALIEKLMLLARADSGVE